MRPTVIYCTPHKASRSLAVPALRMAFGLSRVVESPAVTRAEPGVLYVTENPEYEPSHPDQEVIMITPETTVGTLLERITDVRTTSYLGVW